MVRLVDGPRHRSRHFELFGPGFKLGPLPGNRTLGTEHGRDGHEVIITDSSSNG
jgi:hypothetical protein